MLVPEIALTPQVVARFRARFGDTVAVLHSALSRGRAPRRVAAPAPRRGAHLASARARPCSPRCATWACWSSTRSTTRPTSRRATRATTRAGWLARRARRRRAARCGWSPVRATPRPESQLRARTASSWPSEWTAGRCRPSRCSTSAARRHPLHPARWRRAGRRRQGDRVSQPPRLVELPVCRACGQAWECPHCDVALILHRAQRRARLPPLRPPRARPRRAARLCGSPPWALRRRHRAPRERARRAVFDVPVLRLTPTRAAPRTPARAARRFAAVAVGVLVGTQMVAKGHDFPA